MSWRVLTGAVGAVLLLLCCSPTLAFTTPQQQPLSSTASTLVTTNPSPVSSVTSLEAFQFGPWNLNKGENASPFGFDLNAEIWNGRVAQVSGGSSTAGPVALVCDLLNWGLADYHHELMVSAAASEETGSATTSTISTTIMTTMVDQVVVVVPTEVEAASSSFTGFLTFHFLGSVNEQVSFVWVFLQESITGKGMLQGIERGDQAAIVSLGLFCMLIATLAVSFLLAPPPEKKEAVRKVKAPRPDGWSDKTAFERAKSIAKMLDPSEKVDELILNFNNGRSPFGLKKNAEVWNGRIAMISFLWVFAQELIERKGVTQSLEAHDTGSLASLVAFLTLVTGITGVLVTSDESTDYVERIVERQDLLDNAKNPDWRPRKMDQPYSPLPISSLSPDKAASNPPTFDQYQRELERALRSMNGEVPRTLPSDPIRPAYQPMEVYASQGYATAPRPAQAAPVQQAVQRPLEVYASQSYAAAPQRAETSVAPMQPAPQQMDVYASQAYSAAPKRAESLSTQTPPGLDFQAQLAESLRSMTSGSPVVNKPTESAPSTDRAPSVKLPDIAKMKEMVQSIPKPSLKLPEKKPKIAPDFKVDGYRFKDTTRKMVVDTSPHPSGSFSFSADNTALIKDKDETDAKRSLPPTAFKGNASPHPVEGFKFGSTTKDVIQSPSMPATGFNQQEQQLSAPPLQTTVSPEYAMPATTSYQQEQQLSPPPPPKIVSPDNPSVSVSSPFTTGTKYRPVTGSYLTALNQQGSTEQPPQEQQLSPTDYASVSVSSPLTTSTNYRPVTGSYLTALNQVGNTEQPLPSYSSWTTNEPAKQKPPQPQTSVVAPDYARIEVVRSPYRPTMGSYLDAINQQGSSTEQPSQQIPFSYGFEVENEPAQVAVAAPPGGGRRRVTSGSYLSSLSP